MFQASFAGFIGGEIKHQALDTGNYVARFRVAISDRYRDSKGEWCENETIWVTCQAWGDLARHIAKSFASGTPVVVLGEWRQQNYEQDGRNKSTRFVEVRHVGENLAITTREKPAEQPKRDTQPQGAATTEQAAPAETKQEEDPFE